MKRKKSEIKIAYENMMRKKKIEAHLASLVRKIKMAEKEATQMFRLLQKEATDVKQLEKLNLLSLFRQILGNQEQELEKQRQEYLMYFLKHQGAEKNLKALHFEKKVLEKQLSGLFNADKKFEILYNEIEPSFKLLLDDQTKAKIKRIELSILNHEEKIKEIREAVQAGKKSEKLLLKILDDLSFIKKWGNPFIANSSLELFGKGGYSSRGKKQFVQNARTDAQNANILLELFEMEILDIYFQFKLDYRDYIKSFSNFLEIFYDNLITDWIVKKRITNTINAIETIHDKVARIIAMLENEVVITKGYIKEEEKMKKEIIINY